MLYLVQLVNRSNNDEILYTFDNYDDVDSQLKTADYDTYKVYVFELNPIDFSKVIRG